MGKLKIKFLTLALIAMAVTLITQGSLSYFTTAGSATGVVTSGNIRLIIHERTDQGTPFPEEGVYIVPGDVVSKQVYIENDCEHPFYLRVKVVYGVDSKELTADECFDLNINQDNWQFVDGWYYFNGVIEPGQITPYVFSRVEIVGSKVDNSYIGKTLTLTVVAQAVQSENNPITDGNEYTASGWPKE